MNLDVKDITKKVQPLISNAKKYKNLIFVLTLALIFGFLVLKINGYAQTEPSEDAVTEKLTTVSRPKIDEKALETIQQLEDQNIEVQSLFEQARDNPFSE